MGVGVFSTCSALPLAAYAQSADAPAGNGAAVVAPVAASATSATRAEKKQQRIETHTEQAGAVAKQAESSGNTHGEAVTPVPADVTAALAPAKPSGTGDVNNLLDMFTQGHFSGNVRAFYYSTHNGYFTKGENQDTMTWGGELAYTTARLYGFSVGVSGYIQRGFNHSDNADQVDSYLGPTVTTIGLAYLNYQHDIYNQPLSVTIGNQTLDVPFASTYDWRIAPELYQGINVKYGTGDNYLQAFRMFRYKSYTDNSFTKMTNYNANFDPYSGLDNQETNGFWGVGGAHAFNVAPVVINTTAWYQSYLDYADLVYAEGKVSKAEGSYKPFAGVQVFHETGNGRELMGHVDAQAYGAQLGVKHNSITVALSYDYMPYHGNAYLNGSMVTPYAHGVSSDPMFAQPFLTSTQDLGTGSAYALDVSGAPFDHWFMGARYSFMDTKETAGGPSLNQSEYMVFAIYNFSGKLQGLSVTDFFAYQTSPTAKGHNFVQNRLQLEYAWGGK